jgi:hypothetical protein
LFIHFGTAEFEPWKLAIPFGFYEVVFLTQILHE